MNYNCLQYWISTGSDGCLRFAVTARVPYSCSNTGIFTLRYFSLPNMFVCMSCTVQGMGSARMFFLPRKVKQRVHQSISPFLSPRRTSNLGKKKDSVAHSCSYVKNRAALKFTALIVISWGPHFPPSPSAAISLPFGHVIDLLSRILWFPYF